MKVSALSDIGRIREINQDQVLLISQEEVTLLAVFDGMGGANAGEVASETAKKVLESRFMEQDFSGFTDEQFKKWLKVNLDKVNQAVLSLANNHHEYEGMGTTCVCALIQDERAWIANIGDSRAYHYHDGQLSQITEDHSWVNEMIKRHEISVEEAKYHPRRAVITNVLGVHSKVKIDLFSLNDFEMLLLSSDGMHNMLNDEEIRKILSGYKQSSTIAKKLVEAANRAGGYDNITVCIAWRKAS